MNRKINIDLVEYWRNNLLDSIERYSDCISFDTMSQDVFVDECLETITYYFDNEMLAESVNYNDIVSDTAKAYEIWTA